MKKFLILCICVLFIFQLSGNFAFATEVETVDVSENQDVETSVASCFGVDAQNSMLGKKKLVDNMMAGFLYEANSQTLLYEWESDKEMYPASLVKLMTALYAIKMGNLKDVVTVSTNALSSLPTDAVTAKLKVGEMMSLEDMLYCLLVSSANDAAVAIAEHISGDEASFVAGMNAYAQEIGCKNTTFVNVHGLHDEAQVTTARDIARILDYGLRNEVFRKIFTSRTHRIEATNRSDIRKLQTSNSLLDSISTKYYDPRVIGGRSGVTENAKRCMAAAAEANGMLLISVVMGSESIYQEDGYSAISVGGYKETTALLDAGFKGYKTAQIVFANQALQQYKVENGDCDLVVGPHESFSSVLPVDASVENLTYRGNIKTLKAPINKGDKIADVQIWSGSYCVGETALYAMNSVSYIAPETEGNPQSGDHSAAATVLTIIVILVVAMSVFMFVRYYPRLKAKKARAQAHNRRRRR